MRTMDARNDHTGNAGRRSSAVARTPGGNRRRVGVALLALPLAVLGVALGPGSTATAAAPSVVSVQVPAYAETWKAGVNSPCPFDVTFTGAGTVRITTFVDRSGRPVRQTVQGSLDHTLYSAWRTLYSIGPATVHTDLTTGQSTVTGLQAGFHLPHGGAVLQQAGRLIVGADWARLDFRGVELLRAEALCAALAP